MAERAGLKSWVTGECDTECKDPNPQKTACAEICLLYTSDAADERSSVDLGGRRHIKKKHKTKKKTMNTGVTNCNRATPKT